VSSLVLFWRKQAPENMGKQLSKRLATSTGLNSLTFLLTNIPAFQICEKTQDGFRLEIPEIMFNPLVA
jgi:hypothetical protein